MQPRNVVSASCLGCRKQLVQKAAVLRIARPARSRLDVSARFGGAGPAGRGKSETSNDSDDAPIGWEKKEEDDGFQERVVQVRRVTKVVKGGKQLSFRAVVVVGDELGQVGVGCAAAKEVVVAVQRAVVDAKKDLVTVPLTKTNSFPHRIDGIAGAAKVMLRPAAEGTGVIAGGAVRVVLELAGVKNAFGKQLGSDNPLNNARAALDGLRNLRTLKQVAADRGITVAELLGGKKGANVLTCSP